MKCIPIKHFVKRFLIHISSQILGSLNQTDLEGIKAWTFNLTVEEEDLLTEAGRQELKQLGERYKKRLPSLINLSAKVCKFNQRIRIRICIMNKRKPLKFTSFDFFMSFLLT